MERLVSSGPIRAATFFTLTVVLMAIGGAVIGDLEVGIRWGLALGVGVGAFAYFFIRPTSVDSSTEDGSPDR
jgi:hypothetical protein